MRKTIKIIGIAIAIVITFLAGYICGAFSSMGDTFDPVKEVTIFKFVGLNETIYFQVNHWGLLGNHSDIIITTENPKSKNWTFAPDRDYRIDKDYLYYKIVEPSTMIIYSDDEFKKPINFMSKVDIRQEIIEDFKDRSNIVNRYKVGDVSKIGLRK